MKMEHLRSRDLSRFAASVWIVLLSAAPALAQPTASDAETARSYMDEADRLREAGDLWGALERYQAADQLMHVPTTGLDVAKTQAALLQLAEARATALAVAHTPAQRGEPKVFDAARTQAAELSVALAPRIPDVALSVEPASAEAVVNIDGRPVPRISRDLPYKLNPGRHLLIVEAPGFEAKQEQLSLAEGQHAEVAVTLERAAVSGKSAPVAARQPSPRAPEPVIIEGNAGRTRAYIGFAAGGALLITGAVTGITSLVKAADVRSGCRNDVCPESARADVASADVLGTIANIALPLGVIGVGYGVVELLLSGSSERAPEPQRAEARVGLTATGVSVSGSF